MNRLGTILSIALFAACGTAGTGYDGPNGSKADEVAAEDAPVLAESYGYVLSSTMVVCSTRAGDDTCEDDERKTVTATIRGLTAVAQEGAAVDASFSACRLDLNWDGDDYNDKKYLNGDDTLANLGELARVSGSFVQGEDGPILESGLSAFLLGAELSNPVEEDMPRDEDDARALDHDQDGDPGVTVDAPLGKAYIGARVVFNLPLALNPGDDGSLSGSLEAAGFDFAIYDDTIPFVNAQKKANQALDKVMMVSQEHQVTMLPGYVDCATVLEEL